MSFFDPAINPDVVIEVKTDVLCCEMLVECCYKPRGRWRIYRCSRRLSEDLIANADFDLVQRIKEEMVDSLEAMFSDGGPTWEERVAVISSLQRDGAG